ncbi:NUDIX hydrolase [Candidatus Puniceispirillum marinum]|uniref:NUDIX hydrolase n=1 Tax=Puniceispirillum marinum (strain IMCC1322) TaxID=488538 RepID=D5BR05_PUNMI|nr:NUDIX domain-containing protein [Candidatus Puniceispirillum marinum]ADE38719.1 NUDIX hydrolase [Candidatus Puniceispirillum marinum IMCC1322]
MSHKIGVIPFDISGDCIAVMFVTSQNRGSWILPKGDLKANETHKQGCKREAFEEAGVRGTLLTDFPMTVVIGKSNGINVENVLVTYYPLLVTKQVNKWPEDHKRERHWSPLNKVHKITERNDYLQLIKQFDAIAPWILEIAKHKKALLQA